MTDAQTVAREVLAKVLDKIFDDNRNVVKFDHARWNDQVAIIAAALQQARREAFEEAATIIRAQCCACNGSGYANGYVRDDGEECEYCGRPMLAIQAAQEPPQEEGSK